jgi:hypothetical protein
MAMTAKKLVAGFILVLGCLACHGGMKTPPQELMGTWITDAPAYQDRCLRFDSEHVLFGVGEDTQYTIQHIVGIDVRQDGKQTIYTIRAKDAEGTHELVFTYDPSDGGSLQIKNVRGVAWRKLS